MSASRVFAVLAYLLPLIGPALGLVLHRDDGFVRWHARQALALIALAVVVPLIWLLVALVLLWIPSLGAILAAGSFGLVIAVSLLVVVSLVLGAVRAARGGLFVAPIVGAWVDYDRALPPVTSEPVAVAANE